MEEKSKMLEKKYSSLPNEIKNMKRWVCFNKSDKIPMNPITGKNAATNNFLTWSSFEVAIKGCEKYNFDGIGFMLGNGIFGIDLDNHEGAMSSEEFNDFSKEFITALNSYTERSQSGNGIHIICKGKLPIGSRRKGNVEMYDSGRYFAMTGDIVNDMPIENREEEVKVLWEKYLKTEVQIKTRTVINSDGSVIFGNVFEESIQETNVALRMSDDELMAKIKASKNGQDFIRLYLNGDISSWKNDHSSADMALCTILSFWTNRDANQIDRIFRHSALMRDKWDQRRTATTRNGVPLSEGTYGSQTIEYAIFTQKETYNPPKEKTVINTVQANKIVSMNNETEKSINDNGDPIISNLKKNFKHYSLDDTGNAERFYDYFGHLFKYNKKNNVYMYWNNKTWVYDNNGYTKKYADELIKIFKVEAKEYEKTIEERIKEGADEDEVKQMQKILSAMEKNISRVSNSAGKKAMLEELEHLHLIPVDDNNKFDAQEYLVNTDSGVVNLETGEIMPFDPALMLSKNTNCKVDFEEPVIWLKFLHDVFERENKEETEELIKFIQEALFYSLTGRTNKDKMFILWGDGSNGKSTFVEAIKTILGDYAKPMNSAVLMQNNSSSQSTEFALSTLLGARFVPTSETAEGKHLDEVLIKQMTSSEEINAQFKYGQPFSFKPRFCIWMSTNNKPIIRATDYGTWRRLCLIPFINTFSEEKKDIEMPKKLLSEAPKILGWIIKGGEYYKAHKGDLKPPKFIEEALADYKNEMNVLSAYLSQRTQEFKDYKTQASVLYQDYKEWAKNNSEYLMSETKFGKEMTKRGYEKTKTRKGIFYIGLKLFSDHTGAIFEDELDD